MTRLKYNDQYHSYWIDGERATGVSTVAKGFQDSYNIDRKVKRDVAKGMARRPDLCSVTVALGDADDWETKKKIDKVATEAIEASGAWAKANHGTAKHTILERVHKGIPLDDVFDDRLVAYAAAYRTLIEAAGLIPVSELTERFVVYPDLLIAGRMDCAYTDGHYGTQLLLGDFKSGAKAVAYPHSIVAQLGLYLNAPFLYNEETDEFDPAPEWGDQIIVAHVPDDITQFGIWTIDANLARTVALAALERHRYIKSEASTLVTQWIIPEPATEDVCPCPSPTRIASTSETSSTRSTTGSTVSTSTVPTSSSTPASSSSATDSNSPSGTSTQPADPFDGLVDGHIADPATPERRQWVIGRLRTLATIDGALDKVGRMWPAGLATFKQSDRHTDVDLDRIIAVIELAEAEYAAPFEEKEPSTKPDTNEQSTTSTGHRTFSTRPATTSTANCSLASTPPLDSSTGPDTSSTPSSNDSAPTRNEPDEGPAADPAAVANLEDAYKALDDAGRAWINGIARDAQTAGRPIHLAGTPTIRRYEIVTGLVTLAANSYDDNDIAAGLMSAVLAAPMNPTGIGAALSLLDVGEAAQFAHLTRQLAAGNLTTTVDNNDGHLTFTQ